MKKKKPTLKLIKVSGKIFVFLIFNIIYSVYSFCQYMAFKKSAFSLNPIRLLNFCLEKGGQVELNNKLN